MQRKAAYVAAAVLVCAFAVAMAALLHATRERRAQTSCESLSVEFTDSLKFVTAAEIRKYLDKNYGSYVGQRIDSVDLRRIEELIESRGPVTRCEAWTDDRGVLHLSITQRAPVLMFRYDGGGYYVDADGYIFPLHDSYTADVPVVEGAIPVRPAEGYRGQAGSEQERKWIEGMTRLHRLISSSRSWSALVEKVSVRDDGDIALKMKGGDEQFIIGSPDALEQKFAKIEKYYGYIVPANRKDHYKTVNLKYKNQIICRQKDI